jgi:hypothetical protein
MKEHLKDCIDYQEDIFGIDRMESDNYETKSINNNTRV